MMRILTLFPLLLHSRMFRFNTDVPHRGLKIGLSFEARDEAAGWQGLAKEEAQP